MSEEVQINAIAPEAWTAYFQNLYQGSSEDTEQSETNEYSNGTTVEDQYYDDV
jgi:hypothetical protein